MIIHGLSECYYVFGGTLKPMPGAVSLSLDPKITAAFDNRIRGGGQEIRYIHEGYDGSIELAAMPFDFYRDILGASSGDDGTFTERYIAVNRRTKFSLIYKSKYMQEILWSCTAGHPTVKRKTDGKGIEIQTIVIPIYARRNENNKIRSFNADPSSVAYSTLFGFKG